MKKLVLQSIFITTLNCNNDEKDIVPHDGTAFIIDNLIPVISNTYPSPYIIDSNTVTVIWMTQDVQGWFSFECKK